MRKLYIFLFIVLVIALIISGAANAYPDFADLLKNGFIAITGQAGEIIVVAWTNISTNPIYQQWHMLIWLVAGGVLMFTAMKAWAKRPAILQKSSTLSTTSTGMTLQKEPAEPEIAPMPTQTTKEKTE